MTSKEKYMQQIAGQKSKAVLNAENRIKDADNIEASTMIALRILARLKELNWTSKKLADKLGVSPQYLSRLLKGNDKFGFEILVKLQKEFMPIFINDIETPKENNSKKITAAGELIVLDFCKSVGSEPKTSPHTYAKVVSINYNEGFYEYNDAKEN